MKDFKDYLELGYGNGETYNYIKCDHKECVDVVKTNDQIPTFLGTTDQFFAKNFTSAVDEIETHTGYDVIYIDADHNHQQVGKDFNNAAIHIRGNGIIFMHDVGPLRERDTLPTASGTAYFNWMGIRYDKIYTSFTYQFNDGDILGIVLHKPSEDTLKVTPVNTWDFYQANKAEILNIKTLTEIEELLK